VGSGCLNLTWYHLEFLRHLDNLSTPFLLIGGQARSHYLGTTSRDLDIWMPTDNSQNSTVKSALEKWSSRFSNRTARPIAQPFCLTEKTQIMFPDTDVSVIDDKNQLLRINEQTKIDILFSLEPLSFETSLSNCEWINVNGLQVPILSQADLLKVEK
jgi:hypothetical protein